MILRQGGTADLSAIARLHAECFARSWDEQFIARLLGAPGAVAFVAGEREETSGFVLARSAAGEAEIISLGVAPDFRRRGIGAELVRTVCARAIEAGVLEIFLEVSVGNAAARALYLAQGFREVGRRPNYYGDAQGEARHALILRRALTLHPQTCHGPPKSGFTG